VNWWAVVEMDEAVGNTAHPSLSDVIDSNKPVVGTLTLVYDHHVPNLSQKLTEMPGGMD
jgi:NikR C terminal nickel binding domain